MAKKSLTFRRHHVGRALARALWHFEDRVLTSVQAAGFPDYRHSDGTVIRCLPEGEGSRLTELASRARMTKQGMAKLVASLEERGYVRRRPDPEDGRAALIQLTSKGVRLLRAAGNAMVELEADWARLVGKKRLDATKAALFEIAGVFGDEDYL